MLVGVGVVGSVEVGAVAVGTVGGAAIEAHRMPSSTGLDGGSVREGLAASVLLIARALLFFGCDGHPR